MADNAVSGLLFGLNVLFSTCKFYFTVRVTHRLNRRSRTSTGRSLLLPPVCRPALAPGWRVTALLWRPVTAAGDGGAVFTCKLRQRGSQGAAIRHLYPEKGRREKANQQVLGPTGEDGGRRGSEIYIRYNYKRT